MAVKFFKSSLFKSSGIYSISSIISASIPFLFIPYLTRVFSPHDYGVLSMAVIIINIISPLIGLSANAAIHRKFFDLDKSIDLSRYIGNVFILLFFNFLIFLIIFLLIGKYVSEYTLVPYCWLLLVLLIAVCQFITTILLTIWQVNLKSVKYGILQVFQSLLNIGFTFLFIYIYNLGWQSRILGQLIAVSVTALISLAIIIKYKYVRFIYNKDDLLDILKFSLPLIPHNLGTLVIGFTDRILITNLINVTETGVYTVAFQIGSVLGLVNAAFINAYVPWLYDKLNLNNFSIKLKIVKLTYFYFLALIIIVLFSIYFLPLILSILLGKAYVSANQFVLWIILGYAFNGMYLMVCGFIFYVRKTKLLSIITVITSIINFPLCYFLLINYGTIGASISMSLIYFISFIATWYLSNKVYEMPWLAPFRFIKILKI